ncbi:hypothetical protein GCK32_009107 [Trichostrongylus colubriformis]|uniref:Uncharacterized protein n=1 Tax=Trichostrongylus colubriformis TaxID=6319 RepID=A0AAN8EP75_TRICO
MNDKSKQENMEKTPSQRTLENLSGMLERPVSMATLSQTLRGLANPYQKESTKGQEDIIFDLFKIPGKNEASIGRLLTVSFSYC